MLNRLYKGLDHQEKAITLWTLSIRRTTRHKHTESPKLLYEKEGGDNQPR